MKRREKYRMEWATMWCCILVTLNINELNVPKKKNIIRLDFKISTNICCFPETHVKYNTERLKVKG